MKTSGRVNGVNSFFAPTQSPEPLQSYSAFSLGSEGSLEASISEGLENTARHEQEGPWRVVSSEEGTFLERAKEAAKEARLSDSVSEALDKLEEATCKNVVERLGLKSELEDQQDLLHSVLQKVSASEHGKLPDGKKLDLILLELEEIEKALGMEEDEEHEAKEEKETGPKEREASIHQAGLMFDDVAVGDRLIWNGETLSVVSIDSDNEEVHAEDENGTPRVFHPSDLSLMKKVAALQLFDASQLPPDKLQKLKEQVQKAYQIQRSGKLGSLPPDVKSKIMWLLEMGAQPALSGTQTLVASTKQAKIDPSAIGSLEYSLETLKSAAEKALGALAALNSEALKAELEQIKSQTFAASLEFSALTNLKLAKQTSEPEMEPSLSEVSISFESVLAVISEAQNQVLGIPYTRGRNMVVKHLSSAHQLLSNIARRQMGRTATLAPALDEFILDLAERMEDHSAERGEVVSDLKDILKKVESLLSEVV